MIKYLKQAEMVIARQLYEYAAYDALIKRMQTDQNIWVMQKQKHFMVWPC